MRDEAMSSLPAVVRPRAEQLSPAPSSLLCPTCFWSGRPQSRLRGSFVVESLLWALGVTSMGLLLLVGQLVQLLVALSYLPGLGYSVWRRSRRSAVCPQCGSGPLLPEDAVYPPTCSHFLFSTEPRRVPDENRGWSVTSKGPAHSPMPLLESVPKSRRAPGQESESCAQGR